MVLNTYGTGRDRVSEWVSDKARTWDAYASKNEDDFTHKMKMISPKKWRLLHPKKKTTAPKEWRQLHPKRKTTSPKNDDDCTHKMKTISNKTMKTMSPKNKDGLTAHSTVNSTHTIIWKKIKSVKPEMELCTKCVALCVHQAKTTYLSVEKNFNAKFEVSHTSATPDRVGLVLNLAWFVEEKEGLECGLTQPSLFTYIMKFSVR